MEETFYLLFILAIIGALSPWWLDTRGGQHYSTAPRYRRIWVAIQYHPSEAKITITRHVTEREKLARDIEVITDGNIAASSWAGYSYGEMLASLTPDQAQAIESYRSFLR